MEWIDASITPPPTNIEVLIYDPYAKHHSAYQAAIWDGDGFWCDNDSVPMNGIRYWIPLPESPPQHD